MKSPLPPLRRRARWLAALPLAAPLLAAAPLHAQQPPPVDPTAILSTLKDLKAKQTQTVAREKSQVMDSIRAAAADPAKAYEQAYLAVEVQGKGGNEGTRMMEWRKQNADQLRDRNFLNALRLEINYIALTWQRHMGAKVRDLLPALYDHTTQVAANADALTTLKLTNKNLNDSLFVRYFQIGPYITGLPEWSSQPFDVDGIFQKTILPELRQQKDPRLLTYWDNKMQTEVASIDQRSNNLAVNRFNNVRRPGLLWNRAEDELLLGDRDRAVTDMLAIIKAHPDHPDFDKWVARLTEVVTPKAEAAPSPVASPAVPR